MNKSLYEEISEEIATKDAKREILKIKLHMLKLVGFFFLAVFAAVFGILLVG